MHRLQELVRLHRMGKRTRHVARLLKMSPNTERKYRNALEKAGLLDGDPGELPALADLQQAVRRHQTRPPQERSSVARWRPQIEQRWRLGLHPTAIHELLVEEEETFSGSLSAVKRLVLQLKRERGPTEEDVAIPVVTKPGLVGQVDFGFVGKLWDPVQKKRRKAWVFVMVLGCSRHAFAKVVFDQTIDTWLQLHVEAFEWFGGVPATVVPDNLKAAVIRAAFKSDEVAVLNRAYRELARHYGFVIDPTPPYAPEKKGKVESVVKYVKRSFFKPRTFSDIDEANVRLATWMVDKAGMRIHGTTGQRPLEVFEAVEKSTLAALPSQGWEPVVWAKGVVGRNSHIRFDRRFWSVPWASLEKEVLVRATAHSVEIYCENHRIATHSRAGVELWSTQEAHLPPGRSALRQREPEYWLEKADAMGEEVGAYIREVLACDEVQRPLRRVASMLRILESVSAERACKACIRASYFANFRANGLRRILDRRLDEQPLPPGLDSPQWSKNPRFARSASAFLAGTEVRHGAC